MSPEMRDTVPAQGPWVGSALVEFQASKSSHVLPASQKVHADHAISSVCSVRLVASYCPRCFAFFSLELVTGENSPCAAYSLFVSSTRNQVP